MLISSFNNVRPFRSFQQGLVFFLSLLTLMTAAQVPSTPDKSSVHLVPGSDTAMNAAAQWYQKETIFLVGGNTYVKNGKSFTGRKMLVKENE
ncbi:hypothetical protein ACWKW6_06735 [Dyadobacter jiangsuensis]